MADFSKEELEAAEAGPEDSLPPVEQEQAPVNRDDQGRFAPREEQPQDEDRGDLRVALRREREGRREEREQLKQAQERLRQIDEARARILAEKSATPEAPKPEDDPSGIEYLKQRLGTVENDLSQRTQRETEQAAQQERFQVLGEALSTSEAALSQQIPDYEDAAQHLINARSQQLMAMGMPQNQVAAYLQKEVAEITENAINRGIEPAALVYRYAQTYGFQGGQQKQANPMFDAIARGQKSKSLSNARGTPPADKTADAIANMSEDEFMQMMNDPDFARAVASMG